jgi:hypothetical protein
LNRREQIKLSDEKIAAYVVREGEIWAWTYLQS